MMQGNENKYTDFDKYSLTNVEVSSPKMWLHLASVFFVSIYTLWVSTG